jgi:hypothetical protein
MSEVVFTCSTCGAKGDPPPCNHFAQAWSLEQIREAHQKLLAMGFAGESPEVVPPSGTETVPKRRKR